MGFEIDCPSCGSRSYHEFWFGGELRPYDAAAPVEVDYRNVWLRENPDGPEVERWFHFAGCRRWLTLERDTRNNQIIGLVDSGGAPAPQGADSDTSAPSP
jgi:heterotetrameric sarcosine oxidase delta subunit